MLPQHKTPHFLFWESLKMPSSAQNTPLFVLSIPQNTLLSTKPPRYALRFAKFSGVFEEDARFYGRIFHGFVHYHGESASFFLSRFPASPKCTKEIFNKVRNCMKTRNLAFKFFGPKCWKFLQKVFVIQKKLLPLHPLNWGRLRPTSWYSIN